MLKDCARDIISRVPLTRAQNWQIGIVYWTLSSRLSSWLRLHLILQIPQTRCKDRSEQLHTACSGMITAESGVIHTCMAYFGGLNLNTEKMIALLNSEIPRNIQESFTFSKLVLRIGTGNGLPCWWKPIFACITKGTQHNTPSGSVISHNVLLYTFLYWYKWCRLNLAVRVANTCIHTYIFVICLHKNTRWGPHMQYLSLTLRC